MKKVYKVNNIISQVFNVEVFNTRRKTLLSLAKDSVDILLSGLGRVWFADEEPEPEDGYSYVYLTGCKKKGHARITLALSLLHILINASPDYLNKELVSIVPRKINRSANEDITEAEEGTLLSASELRSCAARKSTSSLLTADGEEIATGYKAVEFILSLHVYHYRAPVDLTKDSAERIKYAESITESILNQNNSHGNKRKFNDTMEKKLNDLEQGICRSVALTSKTLAAVLTVLITEFANATGRRKGLYRSIFPWYNDELMAELSEASYHLEEEGFVTRLSDKIFDNKTDEVQALPIKESHDKLSRHTNQLLSIPLAGLANKAISHTFGVIKCDGVFFTKLKLISGVVTDVLNMPLSKTSITFSSAGLPYDSNGFQLLNSEIKAMSHEINGIDSFDIKRAAPNGLIHFIRKYHENQFSLSFSGESSLKALEEILANRSQIAEKAKVELRVLKDAINGAINGVTEWTKDFHTLEKIVEDKTRELNRLQKSNLIKQAIAMEVSEIRPIQHIIKVIHDVRKIGKEVLAMYLKSHKISTDEVRKLGIDVSNKLKSGTWIKFNTTMIHEDATEFADTGFVSFITQDLQAAAMIDLEDKLREAGFNVAIVSRESDSVSIKFLDKDQRAAGIEFITTNKFAEFAEFDLK